MERKRTDTKEKLDQPKRQRTRIPADENGFSHSMLETATRLCMLGFTNDRLGKFFGVDSSTIDKWLENPKFKEAVQKGRDMADADVAESLYRMATGYEMEIEEPKWNSQEGFWEIVSYNKRYAPNVTAQIKWLTARRPAQWSETHKVEHDHTVTHKAVEEINMEGFTDTEQNAMFKALKNHLNASDKKR
ncbi:MAG: hypothetical protein KGY70_11505 [Bacteroidales bacterium]|nr:hypothetical protein [Bacteroidales bacterium]